MTRVLCVCELFDAQGEPTEAVVLPPGQEVPDILVRPNTRRVYIRDLHSLAPYKFYEGTGAFLIGTGAETKVVSIQPQSAEPGQMEALPD